MNDLDKLKHLLNHWIEHNDAHIKTYTEWASKTESLDKPELSHIIKQIANDSEKMNALFKKAAKMI